MSDVDAVRIMALVRRTMTFAQKTYHSEWEAAVSLLVGARMIAMKAKIDWPEIVAVVEELAREIPPFTEGN